MTVTSRVWIAQRDLPEFGIRAGDAITQQDGPGGACWTLHHRRNFAPGVVEQLQSSGSLTPIHISPVSTTSRRAACVALRLDQALPDRRRSPQLTG